jgi:hypothetical protein
MDAVTLLAQARAAGLTLRAANGRLVIRGPRNAADLAHRLLEAKPAILQLVARGCTCPHCHRPLDEKRRCWSCCDRRCACGRMTGSAFIELCHPCGIGNRPDRG